MKVTTEKVTATRTKNAHYESITTNLTEFSLAEAVFLHKGNLLNNTGQFVRSGTEYPQGEPAGEPVGETEADKMAHMFKLINNISMAINQHAVLINKNQSSQKKYVEETEVCSLFDKIAESISIYDEEFIQRLEIPDASKYSEDTENEMTNKTHKICNKVLQLGHACYYLYRKQQSNKKEHDDFKENVNQSLENKVSIKQMAAMKEQMDDNTNNKIKDVMQHAKNGFKELEKRVRDGDETLRSRIELIDRTLVGRMSELETLFSSRAATKWVEDSLKDLEERLKRTMDMNASTLEADLIRIRRDQEHIIKKELDTMRSQLSTTEEAIRTLKAEMDIRVTFQGLKDTNKKLEDGINSTLAQKIREALKKYDPIIEGFEDLKKVKGNFLEHEDRFLDFQTKVQTQLVTLTNEVTELKNAPPPIIEQKIELPHIPNIDENEFEAMKVSVRKLKDDKERHEDLLKKTKIALDERIEKSVFTKAIDKKLNRDDIFSILQEFAAKDERVKAMHETLQEVTKRLDYLSDKIDKRILKLKKELDLTSIQKLLRSKADDNEVKKEFESMDFRVKSVDDTMTGVKKDLDGMFTSLKKITDVITLLQQDQATAIGSTRNVLCLSCGRGDATFLPPMKQTKGADGNYYLTHQAMKVNGKIINNKEDIDYGYEVFDKQEVTREHVKASHEPVEAWMDRPATGGGMRNKDGTASLRASKKMPTINKG